MIEECLDTKSRSILNEEIPSKKETFIKLHECKYCLYNSKFRNNLKRHIRTVHNSGGNIQEKKEHICDQCGRVLSTTYALKIHIKSLHEQSFKHICPTCNRGFNRTIQYTTHCKRHLEDTVTDEQCEFCGTKFTVPGSLARHLKICKENPDHMTVEGCVCPICAAVYSTERHLKEHIQGKHESPKYKCSECGKLFSWRSSLKSHQKHSHPGQSFNKTNLSNSRRKSPLDIVNDQCEFCGNQFTIPGSWARHLKICPENPEHEQINGVACPKCCAVFPTEKHLKEHFQGKHQPPTYKCSECNKLFSWRSSLIFHKKNSHPS